MKVFKVIAAAVLVFCIAWLPPSQAAGSVSPGDTRVVVKSDAVVRDRSIRLRDVAEISGPDPALIMDLGSLVVGSVSSLGETRAIDIMSIRDFLEKRPWAHGVILEGASRVEVSRATLRVPEERLMQAGREFVESSMPWDSDRTRVIAVKAEEVLAPEGRIEFEFTPQRGEEYVGDVVLLITVKSDGETVRQVWWRGEVRVETDVLVANRFLERGHVIGQDDVTFKTVTLDRTRQGEAVSPGEIVGKKLRRSLRPGQSIGLRMVEEPPVIKRGEMITVVAESGLMRVSMKAQAREDGCLGDTIRVMNPASKKEFSGQVAGSSLVKVVF